MAVFSPRVARGVNRGRGRLHPGPGGLRVRMRVFRMDYPSLRAASADDAAEEHRPSVAADRVVMSGHVAADPVPHNTPTNKEVVAREGKPGARPRRTTRAQIS